MEYFRWILIAIGLLLLLGIILFANPERKQSMTRSNKKNRHDQQQRLEPVLDKDENVYLQRQQALDGLAAESAPGTAPDTTPVADRQSQSVDESQSQGQASADQLTATAPEQPLTGNKRGPAAANVSDDGIEQLFNNNVFSLYIVAERREPIAGVELLSAAVKIGLDFGEHGIFHRLHAETGDSIFSMANLTAPGSFDPTAWNLFETRGVSLFMPLPGPLGAMNGWDTMLASAERLASLLSARIVNARREPLSRQQVAQIREQMRQFDRRQPRSTD